MRGANINTWMLGLLITLSGWTLKTVHEQAGLVLVAAEKAAQHDREITELRTRVISAEAAILELKLAVGHR